MTVQGQGHAFKPMPYDGDKGERRHLISLENKIYTILLGILEHLEGVEDELVGVDEGLRQFDVGKCGSLFRSYSHPFLVKRLQPESLLHARKSSHGRESKASTAWSGIENDPSLSISLFSSFRCGITRLLNYQVSLRRSDACIFRGCKQTQNPLVRQANHQCPHANMT